jgi:hypothetical protein
VRRLQMRMRVKSSRDIKAVQCASMRSARLT